jgi:hypothetical protein
LAEAKGKGNIPPDVEGAKKADEWFKTIDGLKYKDSEDYMHFPPLTIEMAKEEFKRDKILAYKKGWIPHWYKKGIEELDLDLENKIKENDIILLENNFGKYSLLYEKIKPVVVHWCNKYILTKDYGLKNILFSDNNQIWKTYKKLKEMQLAVKVYSEGNYIEFLSSEIKNIEEYKPYIDKAAKLAAEMNSFSFLYSFSQEPWAKPYLDKAAKLAAESDSFDFLCDFSDEPWAKPYLDEAAKILAEMDSELFIDTFSDKPWAQPYIDKESSNNYKNSLIKLSNILMKMNLEKFSFDVKKLL